MSESRRPHPKALAFRERLVTLLDEALEDAGDDDEAYATILGMLYAEASTGCKASGVPIEFAMTLLGTVYESQVIVVGSGPRKKAPLEVS